LVKGYALLAKSRSLAALVMTNQKAAGEGKVEKALVMTSSKLLVTTKERGPLGASRFILF